MTEAERLAYQRGIADCIAMVKNRRRYYECYLAKSGETLDQAGMRTKPATFATLDEILVFLGAMLERAETAPPIRWKPDQDDATSIDDLFATCCEIHLERMDTTHYWLGIYAGGVQYHIDLHSKRKITAFARELPPPRETK